MCMPINVIVASFVMFVSLKLRIYWTGLALLLFLYFLRFEDGFNIVYFHFVEVVFIAVLIQRMSVCMFKNGRLLPNVKKHPKRFRLACGVLALGIIFRLIITLLVRTGIW